MRYVGPMCSRRPKAQLANPRSQEGCTGVYIRIKKLLRWPEFFYWLGVFYYFLTWLRASIFFKSLGKSITERPVKVPVPTPPPEKFLAISQLSLHPQRSDSPRCTSDIPSLKIGMICTLEPGVSQAHPSGFLAAVRIVDAEITIGGGMVTQPFNWSVSYRVSRSIPRECPSDGPLRPPKGRMAQREMTYVGGAERAI